ncbi:MAG TPA: hypothetical protein VH206_08810 [Xanthobacteraceae bacterium]|jgi:hypothetical protein|nr:hypothetical protein [Xanthobacteraceae bacterium]
MSDPEISADVHPSVPQVHPTRRFLHLSFWVKELPFALVLILTMIGVAYTSFSKHPITGYWEILAPLIALVCVSSGWPAAADRTARLRLILTQVLHWVAFLIVMNMLLLPSVQQIFTANSTGLAIFTLLALGTFTAGVQVLSWQVCLLGLIMALGIPAIAWIENSALIGLLVVGVVVGVVVVIWWYLRERRVHAV